MDNAVIILTPKNAAETLSLMAEFQKRKVPATLNFGEGTGPVSAETGPVLISSEKVGVETWEAAFKTAITDVGLGTSTRATLATLRDKPDGLWTAQLMKIIKCAPQGAVRNYRRALRIGLEKAGYILDAEDKVIDQRWSETDEGVYENFYALWPNQIKALRNVHGL